MIFTTALAWPQDGSFHIKSINTSVVDKLGNKISSVSLVGAPDQTVDFSLQSDGLHIKSLQKPANVEHAFVFRIHMDSEIGFVSWDRARREDQPVIRPGFSSTLRWLSGSDNTKDTADDVNLERWVGAEGRWKPLNANGEPLPNTGTYTWNVPPVLESPLLLRITAAFEDGIEHIAQMPVHVG